jgi:hypothetical protein
MVYITVLQNLCVVWSDIERAGPVLESKSTQKARLTAPLVVRMGLGVAIDVMTCIQTGFSADSTEIERARGGEGPPLFAQRLSSSPQGLPGSCEVSTWCKMMTSDRRGIVPSEERGGQRGGRRYMRSRCIQTRSSWMDVVWCLLGSLGKVWRCWRAALRMIGRKFGDEVLERCCPQRALLCDCNRLESTCMQR